MAVCFKYISNEDMQVNREHVQIKHNDSHIKTYQTKNKIFVHFDRYSSSQITASMSKWLVLQKKKKMEIPIRIP